MGLPSSLRLLIGFSVLFLAFVPLPTRSATPVTIPSWQLEWYLRGAAGNPPGPLTDEDLARVTEISEENVDEPKAINSLEGLQYATNLLRLSLVGGHPYDSIAVLTNLTQLREVRIEGSAVRDISPLLLLTNAKQLGV